MLVVPTAVEKIGGASNKLQQPTNYHFRVKVAMSTNGKRVAKQKSTTMPQERRQAAFCFSAAKRNLIAALKSSKYCWTTWVSQIL